MTSNLITKRRVVVLLLVSALVLLVFLSKWFLFNESTGVFRTISLEEANRGSEVPADDSDPFLTVLFTKCFNWHSLPPHSVQHTWSAGLIHHAERYVIHLSPEDFADLKSHIDSYVKEHPQEPYGKLSLGPDTSTVNQLKWWTPPNKNAFSFSIGINEDKQSEAVLGDYIFEYDPDTQLLYIDATTV
jgi:hypothetical protein